MVITTRVTIFGPSTASALPKVPGAFEPVSLDVAEEARRKTHNTALADTGNRRLEKFNEGDWTSCGLSGSVACPTFI